MKDLTHESARKKEQNKQTELLGFEVSVQFSCSVVSDFLQPYDKQFYMINNNKKTHKNRTLSKLVFIFFFFPLEEVEFSGLLLGIRNPVPKLSTLFKDVGFILLLVIEKTKSKK